MLWLLAPAKAATEEKRLREQSAEGKLSPIHKGGAQSQGARPPERRLYATADLTKCLASLRASLRKSCREKSCGGARRP